MKRRVYVICSVRDCPPEERSAQEAYVRGLELQGYEVHWPPRDVDQSPLDGGAVRICQAHCLAMLDCHEVHVLWSPLSYGSHFDLGMAYMLKVLRPDLQIVIGGDVEPTIEKSFTNVLLAMAGREYPS